MPIYVRIFNFQILVIQHIQTRTLVIIYIQFVCICHYEHIPKVTYKCVNDQVIHGSNIYTL